MTMKGIDVSNWQNGIDLKTVPADFVIIKATEGNYYISEDFKRQTNQVVECGKKLGFYHYANGGNAIEEANFFINAVKEHIGNAILALDWESGNNPAFGVNDIGWCTEFCSHITKQTGVIPFIYVQQGKMGNVPSGYPLWVAQYPDYTPTGYLETPWNEGAYTCAIRQYTSSGTLEGYSGPLDLNKAYFDEAQWDVYASSRVPAVKTVPKTSVSGSTLDLVVATLQGKYGDGQDRINALGDRYEEVQNMINHVAVAGSDRLVEETLQGKYGNGETRKIVLGSRYKEVQNKIDNPTIYHTVISGESLSSIASKYGVNYLDIAKINNISNPDIIYVGQKLKIK